MVGTSDGVHPDRDVRPGRRGDVGMLGCVVEDSLQFEGVDLAVEPQAQLDVREAKLSRRLVVEIGSRLEVARSHGELLGQHPQRLDRRSPGPGLDA